MEKIPTILIENQEKENKMKYPDLENLTMSEKIGANLYDVFEKELTEATIVFEQAGLKITQLVKHEVVENNFTHIHYLITVDQEEKK